METKDKAAVKIKSNEPNALKFFADLAAGGTAGGLSKTVVAPIERVKLLLQTQDSNPRIKSGEIARYTGDPSPMLLLAMGRRVMSFCGFHQGADGNSDGRGRFARLLSGSLP